MKRKIILLCCLLALAACADREAEQRAAQVSNAGGDKFAIGVDRWIGGAGKGASCCDGFGKAHQRNAERSGSELFDQRQIRQG